MNKQKKVLFTGKTFAKITLATIAALSINTSVAASEASSLDVRKVCDVQQNGIQKVIDMAAKYNQIAKKEGLEFMRLGMKTSQYILATQKSIKEGSKTVDIVNKKKKKTGTVSTQYAAWRACSFAITALQQASQAKTTWRMATPGDGFAY